MEKRSTGTRGWLIVVVVLVIAGIVAYFVGDAMQRGAQSQDAANAASRYAAVQAKLTTAQTRIHGLQSLNQLLEANMWTYRATTALDNRNFGVANTDVAKAVASLGSVDASVAGLDAKAVAALQKEAGAIHISVATNLESERNQLLQLADGIGALAAHAAKTE